MKPFLRIVGDITPVLRDMQGGPPADGCAGDIEYHGIHLHFQFSWGMGWEHLSVSTRKRCPTWDEMCFFKDLFWESRETVIQYHPGQQIKVNIHPYCLHLWRPTTQEIPMPPISMV